MMTTTKPTSKEIVLCDGTFCEIRRPQYIDWICASRACQGEKDLFMSAYISRICLFDGEPRSMDDILHMDCVDVNAICTAIEAFKKTAVE